MSTKLNPYLNFKDNARQAMEFYHSVFGGDLQMQTFQEFHAAEDPSEENLIMHAQLDGADCMTLMAADTPKRMEYRPGKNVSMSLSGEHDEKNRLTTYFTKLSDGGTVTQPLEKAVWGDTFGMLTDKFGIDWFVNITGPKM